MKICFQCTDRHMGCHGECERYKLEKEKVEQVRQNKEEYMNNYSALFRPHRR